MADNGGAGTGNEGQSNQNLSGQSGGIPPGSGQGVTPPADVGRNGTGTDGFDTTAWADLAKEFGTPDKLRERLGHARVWEQRAKDNYESAQQASTLQQQLAEIRQQQAQQNDEFQQQLAKRDERDIERAGNTAHAQLRAALAEHGIKVDDIDKELLPDPVRLLKKGEPDDEAITKFAGALAKVAGRPTPDPDQGQRSDDTPTDMNALIRRAAGRA
jgi:hypothetical protein